MKRKILQQKVYHDGTSMVVVKPGDMHEVPARLLSSWQAEGIVAKDRTEAMASAETTTAPAPTTAKPKRDMSKANAARAAKRAKAAKPAATAPAGSGDGGPPAA